MKNSEVANMKPVIDREFCIGCGRCVNVCPEVFRWEPVILAKAEVYGEVNDSTKEKVENAAKVCQTQAITLE